MEKLRSCKVETHFLSERENHRLKVLFSSDGDRISHVSCAFETAVESAVDCTLHMPSVRAFSAGNRVVPREVQSLVPFGDGAFLFALNVQNWELYHDAVRQIHGRQRKGVRDERETGTDQSGGGRADPGG